MEHRTGEYAPYVLGALRRLLDEEPTLEHVVEVSPSELCVDMVLVEDLRLIAGVLLVTRGTKLTAPFVERIRNIPAGSIKQPIRVSAPLRAKAS